jgi:2'-deoxynucleoside 5'-phosphate N-hydrolase
MKIYFAGSIRAGREDVAIYEKMIAWLKAFGEVLTEHVGDMALSERGDDGPDDLHIHARDMEWLSECDLVVAEVSIPSLGVGYELGWAAAMNKPVLCLYRIKGGPPLSSMIAGSPGIYTTTYSTMEEAGQIMGEFISEVAERVRQTVG